MKPLSLVLVVCALAACTRPVAPVPDDSKMQATPPTATAPEPAPAASIPTRFQGAWASDAAACGASGHESRLVIAPEALTFHESSGPVDRVSVNGDDLSLVVKLTGEGETRQARYRFTLSDGGGTLTDREGGMVRRRCAG